MFLFAKLAAAGAAAFALVGSTPPPCTCPPPEVETISCLAGQVSFAKATCTVSQISVPPSSGGLAATATPPKPRIFTRVTVDCPPGETAMSGGYREDLTGNLVRVLEAAPYAPTGAHAKGFRATWRGTNTGQVRVYVICERL